MRKLLLTLLMLLLAVPVYATAPDVRISDTGGQVLNVLTGGQVSESGRALTSGQVDVTASAAALATATDVVNVTIMAEDHNVSPVYIGGSTVTTSTGYELETSIVVTIDIDDLAEVYVIGTAGDQISYIAPTQ